MDISPSPQSAQRRAARCGTPDMDSDEGAWISHGPDPQGNVGPSMPHRSPITYRPCKGDCPLIRVWAGTSSSSTLQTAAEALCHKSEANMNKHRCVSTAVPDDALRVSPQRTPTREKNRPAHCQQRTAPPLQDLSRRDHRCQSTDARATRPPHPGPAVLGTNRPPERTDGPTLPTHGSRGGPMADKTEQRTGHCSNTT
jgi:hypothetical protein